MFRVSSSYKYDSLYPGIPLTIKQNMKTEEWERSRRQIKQFSNLSLLKTEKKKMAFHVS